MTFEGEFSSRGNVSWSLLQWGYDAEYVDDLSAAVLRDLWATSHDQHDKLNETSNECRKY